MFADWFNLRWRSGRVTRLPFWTAVVCAAIQTSAAFAQAAPPVSAPDTTPDLGVSPLRNPSAGSNLTNFFVTKTPYEFWLTCLIALFGLAVIFALLMGIRHSRHTRAEDVARPIIVVTVITGTLMLITVGYNNEQIAPAFGLFGTVVGYMLGRFGQTPQQPAPANPEGPQPDPAPGA